MYAKITLAMVLLISGCNSQTKTFDLHKIKGCENFRWNGRVTIQKTIKGFLAGDSVDFIKLESKDGRVVLIDTQGGGIEAYVRAEERRGCEDIASAGRKPPEPLLERTRALHIGTNWDLLEGACLEALDHPALTLSQESEVLLRLASSQIGQRKFKAAEATIQRMDGLRSKLPQDDWINRSNPELLAWLYESSGQWEKLESQASNILNSSDKSPNDECLALRRLACAQAGQGKRDEALRTVDQFDAFSRTMPAEHWSRRASLRSRLPKPGANQNGEQGNKDH